MHIVLMFIIISITLDILRTASLHTLGAIHDQWRLIAQQMRVRSVSMRLASYLRDGYFVDLTLGGALQLLFRRRPTPDARVAAGELLAQSLDHLALARQTSSVSVMS